MLIVIADEGEGDGKLSRVEFGGGNVGVGEVESGDDEMNKGLKVDAADSVDNVGISDGNDPAGEVLVLGGRDL